ncbi:DUF1338 domain-containing protein [Glaciecola sp. XM2]|uniref:DUF1338 domain-containing protein n=1 Tax=Glaciecola sp. XM2 TaxID=1914931 RepID=UPI001BDF4D50|nr:DUF1338 domain-containing protein [Glaciecola sp. XM2]MBT1449856.1 DUF1338 domain-containing protein [Glaciecola sp. XM2]
MHQNVNALFEGLWQDYVKITPSAHKIHDLLCDTSGTSDIVNDHIALRTFNLAPVNLKVLAAHFEAVGYVQGGEYDFEAKKLSALHFQHPDPEQPKVFISELRVDELSQQAQGLIHALVDQLDPSVVTQDNFLYSGTHWQVSQQDYQTLLAESEYAAWMAAWGYRANHFTVSVNHLRNIDELTEVNTILKDNGFTLNTSGGEIKGGEDVCLAQSSTMADKAVVSFSDGELTIPSCFYEFAQRYPMADGKLYQGFVAASADKIFESTNAQ